MVRYPAADLGRRCSFCDRANDLCGRHLRRQLICGRYSSAAHRSLEDVSHFRQANQHSRLTAASDDLCQTSHRLLLVELVISGLPYDVLRTSHNIGRRLVEVLL